MTRWWRSSPQLATPLSPAKTVIPAKAGIHPCRTQTVRFHTFFFVISAQAEIHPCRDEEPKTAPKSHQPTQPRIANLNTHLYPENRRYR